MNIAPTVRVSQEAKRLDARKCAAMLAADHATKRFQSVPLMLKTSPRNRKDSALFEVAGSMNWGRKARKNSATLGFRTLVSRPCENIVRSRAGASAGACAGTRAV